MSGNLNQLRIKHEDLAGQGALSIVAGNVSAPSGREYMENRHCGDQQPAAINLAGIFSFLDRLQKEVKVFQNLNGFRFVDQEKRLQF